MLAAMGTLVIKNPSINTRPKVGETVIYKFQISDINSGQPVSGLTDIHIMDVMTTQNKHKQTAATETEIKGTYVANLRFNDEGLYYLYIGCPSRGLDYNNTQYRIVYASKN